MVEMMLKSASINALSIWLSQICPRSIRLTNTEVGMIGPKDIIAGYQEWTHDLLNRAHKVSLLSVLFYPMPQQGGALVKAMHGELEWIYSMLVTRVIRNPAREINQGLLPILIGFPDLPVYKHTSTYSLADVKPNDGTHTHALVAMPQYSRLGTKTLRQHFIESGGLYFGTKRRIANIDVSLPIPRSEVAQVVDYHFKHLKRRSFTADDVLILPRSMAEMRNS